MGAIDCVSVRGVTKRDKTPEVAARLAEAQALVGGKYDRVAAVWRDGSRTEKELLLHLSGCPVKWAGWAWEQLPCESQIQIRERARAMRSWLDRLVGVTHAA